MTTDHYYHHQYSPPVSPKSIPHGFKRKASLQDVEVEDNNTLISHSFKKLRLNSAKHHSCTTRAALVGSVSHDASCPPSPSYSHLDHMAQPSRHHSHSTTSRDEADDFMTVDDTPDRIWVNDLDAEIAAIEAAEAEQQNSGLLSDTGREYSKIPEHLLRQNPSDPTRETAANMQLILYRDPISISVPEEDDAVRKTIIDARRRMREQQAQDRRRELLADIQIHQAIPALDSGPDGHEVHDVDEDSMELD